MLGMVILDYFDPMQLYYWSWLVGIVPGAVVAAFAQLPLENNINVPRRYAGPVLVLIPLFFVWLVGLPLYVDATGVSATRGFVADGEHYVFDMTDPVLDPQNQARNYRQVSAARWWWLLFCEGSQFFALNAFVGFFLPQVVRRIVALAWSRLRDRQVSGAEPGAAPDRRDGDS